MNRIQKLAKAKSLLQEALSLTSMSERESMGEVRHHVIQALEKIDKITKSNDKRQTTQSQFENWWGKVVSGTAAASHSLTSAEARNRSLSQLNSMIDLENKKINELENQISNQSQIKATPNIDPQMLTD